MGAQAAGVTPPLPLPALPGRRVRPLEVDAIGRAVDLDQTLGAATVGADVGSLRRARPLALPLIAERTGAHAAGGSVIRSAPCPSAPSAPRRLSARAGPGGDAGNGGAACRTPLARREPACWAAGARRPAAATWGGRRSAGGRGTGPAGRGRPAP